MLAERYGIAKSSVSLLLKRRGLVSGVHRTYTSDETYFDHISNESRAYWLGFIAADGNVYRNTLSIQLHQADFAHLEAFRTAIHSSSPIEQNGKYCRLRIHNQQLTAALRRNGIVPAKTRILKPPQIPFDLLRHYYRGFFDGDGWLSYRPSKKTWYFGLSCASLAFMDSFVTFIQKQVPTKAKVIPRPSIYQFTVSGPMARSAAAVIYESCEISLHRKMQRYLAMT